MNIVAADLFAALAHETRLRCLMLLHASGERCVCEITDALGVAQPNVSRHLGQLRAIGLVVDRREGLWIHYRINPELPAWVAAVIQQAAGGTADTAPFCDDRVAMAAAERVNCS